jgi:hypothetical protein
MYCSKCGSFVNEGLNYCKNCGTQVANELEKKNPRTVLTLLLPAFCLITLGGLALLVVLVGVLLRYGITPSAVGVISVFYLATLAAICYVLLGEFPKLLGANLEKNIKREEPAPPVRLAAPTTAQLEEYRQPATSVTENTTRTLDKIESDV